MHTKATKEQHLESGGPVLLIRSLEVASVGLKLLVPLMTSALTQQLGGNFSGDEDQWERYWASGGNVTNAHRVVQAMEELGPTYVKFGQALASRPDVIPKTLASTLAILQDDMLAFDTNTAKDIIRKELTQAKVDEYTIEQLISSLSEHPVAAASIGQVYKGNLVGFGEVAVKVQRPGIRMLVEKDSTLLKAIANFVESIPSIPGQGSNQNDKPARLINTEIVSAVDEFMSRIFEELNYVNEANNAKMFAELYAKEYGAARLSLPGEGVVVPKIAEQYCTENILVMEWIDGTKLANLKGDRTDLNDQDADKERLMNLALIEQALYVTMSQLLDHGLMHADPHGGNLLRVTKHGLHSLAYLDFGLLSTIPPTVRDGLVCAVAQLIFAKDVEAVACLFSELDLLPDEIINDSTERKALTDALEKTLEETLVYPVGEDLKGVKKYNTKSTIPTLKFDKLLDGLVRLVPRFKFRLPPYFINNARALSTLEGIARSLDPTANAFTIMYPYALNRILENPSKSPVVEATLQSLIRDKNTGRIDRQKISRMLRDSALFSGFSRRKVLRDVLKTKTGRKLAKEAIVGELNHVVRFRWLQRRIGRRMTMERSGLTKRDYLRL
jgi:aarF domain-containing kinase